MFDKVIGVRNKKMILNVLFSFFTKGGIAVIGLLLVPITLKILTKTEFGIWQTLSSIISWFYFLDIGLGNGFRNKYTKTLAENNFDLANQYLSTIYAFIGVISISLIALFELINPFLNWGVILNYSDLERLNFSVIIQIVFISFCLKLFLSVLSTTLIASHKFGLSNFIEFLSNLLILCVTYWIYKANSKSLVFVSAIYSIIPILVLIVSTFLFFANKSIRPSLSFVNIDLGKSLLGKGFQFFIIQIAFIFMFTSNNMIIAQIFGQESVAYFTIVSKYFSIPIMGFAIIMGPFWAGFTEAYFKNDLVWIKKTIFRLIFIWLFFLGIIWVMYFNFEKLTAIWIGDKIKIDTNIILFYALFSSIMTFNSIFSSFLNGVEVIRVQLIGSVFLGFLNIPLALYFCHIPSINISGVILSSIVCLSIGSILGPLQTYYVLTKKAEGIWIK